MQNRITTDEPAVQSADCRQTDVGSSVYYGTLSINPKMLTVVKVIKGDFILDTRMITISFWRNFLEKGDYKYAVSHIEHTTNSYYKPEQLGEGCDEAYFNHLYNIALQQF